MKESGYLDDTGSTYRVALDAWDWNGTIGGATLFNRNSPKAPIIPPTIKMRYVNAYLKSNPTIRRRFFVGNKIALKFGVNGGSLIGSVVGNGNTTGVGQVEWIISSVRGELRQF